MIEFAHIKKNFNKIKRILLIALAKMNPAYLKLLKMHPESICISVTPRCNARCVMCSYWKNNKNDVFTTDDLKSLISQAAELCIKSVLLYGGEPLVRSDIYQITSFAKDNGLCVNMITNGLLLDHIAARKLCAAKIDNIQISIDAVGKLHDKLRGIPGAFKKALRAIDNLQNAKKEFGCGLQIQIASLIMKPTLGDDGILGVLDLAKKINVSFFPQLLDVSIPYLKDTPGLKHYWLDKDDLHHLDKIVNKIIEFKLEHPNVLPISVPALRFIKRYFRDPLCKDVPCLRGLNGEIWVNYNGDVHTCSTLPPLGNIFQQSLKSIVLSKSWIKQNDRMFQKDCPGCSCNYPVNVESSINFLFTHLKYKIKERIR